MSNARWIGVVVLASLALGVACGGSSEEGNGQGGASQGGGTTGGVASSTGGSPITGGAVANTGGRSSGGAVANTGGRSSGGARNTGGRSSGGEPQRGGAPSAGGNVGSSCGVNVCGDGQYCCNASCGICAPMGAGCIQIACDPSSGGGSSGSAACNTAADCRLFDDYCTGCDCRALSTSQPDPVCAGPGVNCFVAPCLDRSAACRDGRCVVD